MVKKCPPGVICIENITIIFLISILCLAGFVWYKFEMRNKQNKDTHHYINISPNTNSIIPKLNSVFSTNFGNVLMNPFTAPLKNGNYFPNNSSDPRGIPINVNTRGFDTTYRQVGILTRNVQISGEEVILAVMGRPLYSNRSKWQYYTMNDKSNAIKLPMSHNGRSCTNEYGCDELMSGDTVYVEGYNDAFKVTIYENSQPRYIPFL